MGVLELESSRRDEQLYEHKGTLEIAEDLSSYRSHCTVHTHLM
jgi:hypothetical protein